MQKKDRMDEERVGLQTNVEPKASGLDKAFERWVYLPDTSAGCQVRDLSLASPSRWVF